MSVRVIFACLLQNPDSYLEYRELLTITSRYAFAKCGQMLLEVTKPDYFLKFFRVIKKFITFGVPNGRYSSVG